MRSHGLLSEARQKPRRWAAGSDTEIVRRVNWLWSRCCTSGGAAELWTVDVVCSPRCVAVRPACLVVEVAHVVAATERLTAKRQAVVWKG